MTNRKAMGLLLTNHFKNSMRWFFAFGLMVVLQACAVGPKEVWQKFAFDGREDGWADTIDLRAYAYGDQDRMVRDDVAKPRGLVYRNGESIVPQTNINGPMPIGEFLYVKWRIRETGQIFEERIDLRSRLPRDMSDHGLTFVIEGKQLFVYVITPKPKPFYGAPPEEKAWISKQRFVYEIFPQLKKP